VVGHTEEGGIILDRTIFYARGGGQPGDSGTLDWTGGRIAIATAVKGEEGAIILIPAEPGELPPVGPRWTNGSTGTGAWGHMRIHTALHLLSVVIELARHRRCCRRGERAARFRHARAAAGP
jgi:misacylated tRNA(Ala) deacylase